MALYSDLPVYKSTYDLLLAIFRFTKDFGKEYKYTVGESLKKETIEQHTFGFMRGDVLMKAPRKTEVFEYINSNSSANTPSNTLKIIKRLKARTAFI